MSYILDTNTCIKILNGTDDTVRKNIERAGEGEVIIPSVVRYELFYGAFKSDNPEKTITLLSDFLCSFKSMETGRKWMAEIPVVDTKANSNVYGGEQEGGTSFHYHQKSAGLQLTTDFKIVWRCARPRARFGRIKIETNHKEHKEHKGKYAQRKQIAFTLSG